MYDYFVLSKSLVLYLYMYIYMRIANSYFFRINYCKWYEKATDFYMDNVIYIDNMIWNFLQIFGNLKINPFIIHLNVCSNQSSHNATMLFLNIVCVYMYLLE